MRRRSENGQSLVEMALVAPLLLLLLAGVVDFGRAFHDYIVIMNSAREGARIASRLPCRAGSITQRQTLKTTIQNAVIQEAVNSGVTLAATNVTISPDPINSGCYSEGGSPITVRVDYTVSTILGSLIGVSAIPMPSQTSMVWFGND